jgi:hypothetical protein
MRNLQADTLRTPPRVTYGEPLMATIIVGPPMGYGRRRTWTTWRVPAQQFLDRRGIGVLVRCFSAMRGEASCRPSLARRAIRVERSHRRRLGFAISV